METPKGRKIKATVAGLPKGTIEHFAKRTKQDVYKVFDNLLDFTIDSEDMEVQDRVKLGRKYHDEKMVFFIDGEKVLEYSSCTLYPTTFTLKMNKLYLAHLINIQGKVQGGKYGNNFLH